MATTPYFWGIDIGKAALKALRCRVGSGPRKLIVDDFEYIEFPTFLSQPDADAEEYVRNALGEFTSRHVLKGDTIAVGVPGHLGLTKFIKLPPIESKKIPDIVKYEARQQIPFPLEQVVWDWQKLAGGIEESGFVIDSEVALFAMKSDQVEKQLKPLTDAGVFIDFLQLNPIALANLAMFDLLPDPVEIDIDNPPPSVAMVSMGVDSTDLVITNGLRVWQRTMSIGGNSFTKALIKDKKLTFASAEELKCNAVRSEDPKAVYTSMRPVFDEFAVELQRSLSYFTSTDRSAEIGKVFMLGSAAGLRGLSDYVGKQLHIPTRRLELFQNLDLEKPLKKPLFRDNRLAFGACYGLAVQAAGRAGMHTNLLPQRIVIERKIDEKKPWAVAALVAILIASVISFSGGLIALSTFDPKLYASALSAADSAKNRSQGASGSLSQTEAQQAEAIQTQKALLSVQSRRFQILDMMRALETLLPRDPPGSSDENVPISDRRQLYIEKMDCQYYSDLATWFEGVQVQWDQTHPPGGDDFPAADESETNDNQAAPPPEAGDESKENPEADTQSETPLDNESNDGEDMEDSDSSVDEQSDTLDEAEEDTGPTGAGWVIELAGHHFHNEPDHKPYQGAQFLRSTLIRNLLGKGSKATISGGPRAGEKVTVDQLGLRYPVIMYSSPIRTVRINDPNAADAAMFDDGDMGDSGFFPRPRRPSDSDDGEEVADDPFVTLRRYDFVVQLVWKPRTPGAPQDDEEQESTEGGF